MSGRVLRACAVVIDGATGLFVVLMTWAMLRYPGGTWYRPSTHGERFFRNFICDTLRNPALNGQPNPVGSRLALASMVIMAIGLLVAWLTVPALIPEQARLGRVTRGLGVFGTVCLAIVPVLTSERCGYCHTIIVSLAALPSFGALGTSLATLWLGAHRVRYVKTVGLALLGVAAVTFVWYAVDAWRDRLVSPAVAALEKIGALLLVVWLGMLSAALRQRSSNSGRELV